MQKTIRDLFTQEEWDLFAKQLAPQLMDIAQLPLPDQMQGKETADGTD